ncbi:MAG: hypothetical protein CM15mP49_22020 [Actinomycetota bacterium]|nr:MAG: hypothetical protein CM15mP49_22020 [Actinomycetota bacterium]
MSAAYDVIGDPATRSKYDEARRMGPGMGGFSSDFGGQTGDISDLINSMFGGGFSQSRSPRPQRGPSHEAQLRLSFDGSDNRYRNFGHSGNRFRKIKTVKIRIPAGSRGRNTTSTERKRWTRNRWWPQR